jgi:aspartate ammonia-lyase
MRRGKFECRFKGDFLGNRRIPANAYGVIHADRAIENFSVSGNGLSRGKTIGSAAETLGICGEEELKELLAPGRLTRGRAATGLPPLRPLDRPPIRM